MNIFLPLKYIHTQQHTVYVYMHMYIIAYGPGTGTRGGYHNIIPAPSSIGDF